MAEAVKVESYTFTEFQALERNPNTIRFRASPDSGNDVVQDDIVCVTAILRDMGKWESLINTGLSIFSELGFIHAEENAHPLTFGTQLYGNPTVELDNSRDFLWCFISLTTDERHRRERTGLNPIFQTLEIESQLKNVPKWKAFEKTLTLLKNRWTSS
jgi:hypothetical protein